MGDMMETGEKIGILHENLSYAIVGAAMDVHNKLGPGWDEEAYHNALLLALTTKGIKTESKRRGYLRHRDLDTDVFELDILVEGKIILELKHLVAPFAPAHYLQLINYLKYWNLDLGLLINFGLDKLQYKRIPFTPVSSDIVFPGPWDAYRQSHFETASTLESIARAVFDSHGLGYSSNIYKNLFKAECDFRQVTIDPPLVKLVYDNVALGPKRMDAFCMDGHTLLLITALGEGSSAVDLRHMISYLHQAGLSRGVIANYGNSHLNLKLVTIS